MPSQVLRFSVALFMLFSFSVVHNTADIEQRRLLRSARCPGLVISRTHCHRTLEVRSVLECVIQCQPDSACLSVKFDSRQKMCYLCDDISKRNCSNMEPGTESIKYYEAEIACRKPAQTMGPEGECVCAEGYRSKPCVPYSGDCNDLSTNGIYTKPGVYMIHPLLASEPFTVYCKKLPKNDNTRTYVMDRTKDTTNFNRNFSEYQAGFGDMEHDHWVGLEKLYLLTNSRSYELRVSCRLENGSNLFMLYQNFQVTHAQDGYRLRFNQTRDNSTYLMGDCFTPLLGAKFSTYDNDNDDSKKVNCAERHQGGLVVQGRRLQLLQPHGPLLKSRTGRRSGIDAEAFWTHNLGDAAMYVINMYLIVM